jgi:hypothetical protein
MISFNEGSPDAPLDAAIKDELSGLLTRLCDGELAESDRQRLNQILDQHASARVFYLQYIALHSALAITAGSPYGGTATGAQLAVEQMTLERFAGRTQPVSAGERELPVRTRSRPWRSEPGWMVALAAGLLTVLVAWWWVRPANRFQSGLDPPTGPANVSGDVTGSPQLVAEVTYVSDPAVWQNPNASFALGAHVRAGQVLTPDRGQIELTYPSGAKLLLVGPSEFLVQPMGGKLRRGELVARVPEAGHGFTIETPHGKIIDLGTEFGVVVDDFGVSQVSVFEGKVETLPTGGAGIARNKIELTSGRAIQWTDNSVIPISPLGRRYQRLGAATATTQGIRLATTALDERFRTEQLESGRWRTLGDVSPTQHGLRMRAPIDDRQRPYLITTQEFDPSFGAVTVVCDLRFVDVLVAEDISCAILTRSSDHRSKPGTPWQDMLSRSVSGRLAADPLSGDGTLETGTKYEADRELTNISWGGFSRPQSNVLYRLEMHDDGLNVSLTVSLVDNPLVRKTITCRSLFRGNRNFIALEGPAVGTMEVERLVISQAAASMGDVLPLAADAGDPASVPARPVDVAAQLAEWSPADAVLLVEDDFDSDELNSDIWATLGDVVVLDGELQLGLPNSDEHIDTWRARPYLLTKQHIDPADGALTILGKATFAENFLQGYGGSFAVMTRALGEHGGGSGWESSILRRGIRANFWPAAYGFDHSLEILEKSDPDTIVLSAAEGFRILPHSRSYLFRIVDDGYSVALTVADVANSAFRKTISRGTTSTFSSGHIAFESCWGSPVLLDRVRIFQAKAGR